jgi:hypothetical protein
MCFSDNIVGRLFLIAIQSEPVSEFAGAATKQYLMG